MLEFYSSFFLQEEKQQKETSKVSVCHIMAYSIEQIITAYKNNIWSHFPKYVKRFITCSLMKKFLEATPKPSKEQLKEQTKEVKKQAAIITNHLLYGEDKVDISNNFNHLVPNLGNVENRLYDMKTNCWRYLQYMIWINKRLETDFTMLPSKMRKLYNPLGLISSLVPNHIRIDTSGLCQLLMTKERIKEFVNLFVLNHKVVLNMKNKSDMLSSYSKLTGKTSISEEEEATYKKELWLCLCDFRNYRDVLVNKRKNGDVWVFDNMVLTDGYSVSFQVTKGLFAPLKQRFKKKDKTRDNTNRPEATKATKKRNKKDQDEPKEFEDYKDEAFQKWWSDLEDKNMYKVLGCDPGKKDILTLTDGVTTLCYTKGQKDEDTFKKVRDNVSLQKRKRSKVKGEFGALKDPSIHDYESKYMSGASRKTCDLEVFLEHWKRRRLIMKNTSLYRSAYFRNIKFTVYVKSKSSEDKFFSKVKKTFLGEEIGKRNKVLLPRPKIRKWMHESINEVSIIDNLLDNQERLECSNILIGYGNWGKNPNLKGNAPTPGIGVRRRMNKYFKTVTVNEHLTSKTCPCCGEMTLEHPRVGKEQYSRHHLQRCTNVNCSCSWWNRNVVGSFNITKRFFEESLVPKGKLGTSLEEGEIMVVGKGGEVTVPHIK